MIKTYFIGFLWLVLLLSPISLALIFGPWTLLIGAAAAGGWQIKNRLAKKRRK